MRRVLSVVISLAALAPLSAVAAAGPISKAWVAHTVLRPGQVQTVYIQAKNLSGNSLSGASVTAVEHVGASTRSFHAPKTDNLGRSSFLFRADSRQTGRARLDIQATAGYLTVSARTSFAVSALSVPSSISLSTQLYPATIRAPDPAYLVVVAHDNSGKEIVGAHLSIQVTFAERMVTLPALTDGNGVASVRIDTALVHANEDVTVLVNASWRTSRGSRKAVLHVVKSAPTARPTPAPTATSTPLPTATPTPVVVGLLPAPTPTQNSPTATPTTAVPAPTSTAVPTPTGVPLPTNTPVPTSTPLPTNTPTLTATVLPVDTPTPTVAAPCPGQVNGHDGCMDALVNILNSYRAQYNLPPLRLNLTQSLGSGSCVGSIGHSQAMAESGSLWHSDPRYPAASFPNNICVPTNGPMENVGQSQSGSELQDLQTVTSLMMSETHDPYPQACQGVTSHACDILNRRWPEVGIGIVYSGNTTWVTEDFVS